VYWVRVFIRYHGLRHPATLGGADVERFLSWLATSRRVAASTHKQALSALLFFYRMVLGIQLPWMTEIGRPRVPWRLPEGKGRKDRAVMLPQRLIPALREQLRRARVPCAGGV